MFNQNWGALSTDQKLEFLRDMLERLTAQVDRTSAAVDFLRQMQLHAEQRTRSKRAKQSSARNEG